MFSIFAIISLKSLNGFNLKVSTAIDSVFSKTLPNIDKNSDLFNLFMLSIVPI